MFTLNPPLCLVALLITTGGAAAWAERADRGRPMTLESDQPCTVSLLKQTSVCSGNVVISQGTLQIRADKLELRETPEGYQMALATGSAAKPATYRQKRDGSDETVEGQAQRIDYDSRAGTLRFEGAAVVRRLRGSTVADEIQGQQIVWDSTAESFNVRGGAATASNPGGRVRAVITPRVPPDDAAAAPAPAASGALKASPSLGDRR
ncbi:lipopolysaccharide transport periplasmic protein LptA [Pseudaquabacterium pictum]|uniref:Lipopolysaccharide export system protein LptA n=1 Tax=Pseudaquabacterium pictum TaxID=2315236 RepID=A0A480AT57_9BURK|nr:lipopolysaccharide transport periplasmic protein LptA [Rubrivivax pictus]GCL64581.1 lipopolysaccharide export system protein LptA [Rubrivivax pictus]